MANQALVSRKAFVRINTGHIITLMPSGLSRKHTAPLDGHESRHENL